MKKNRVLVGAITALCAAVLLAFPTAFSLAPPTTQQIIDQASYASVIIIANDKETPDGLVNSFGAGFFIDRNLILTNDHVIGLTGNVTIITRDRSREYSATTVYSDPFIDLALVRIDNWKEFNENTDWLTLYLANETPSQGDPTIILGHPNGFPYSASKGIVSNPENIVSPKGLTIFFGQTDARLLSGNSGGPVLNSNGEVIGVANWISIVNGGSIGFYIPKRLVEKFLTAAMIEEPLTWPRMGIQLGPDNEGNGRGIIVSEIVKDSNADGTDIQIGDKIVAVKTNDDEWVTIDTPKDVLIEVTMALKGDTMTLRLENETGLREVPVLLEDAMTSMEAIEAFNLDQLRSLESDENQP